MKHLVFVGPKSSGKTTCVGRTAIELNRIGFEIVPELKDDTDEDFYGLPPDGRDFYVVLKRGGEYILCYSWSDAKKFIEWLKRYVKQLEQKNINLALIVMASRIHPDWLYRTTERIMGLNNNNRIEIPLGKITSRNRREESVTVYMNTVLNLVSRHILPGLI